MNYTDIALIFIAFIFIKNLINLIIDIKYNFD